MCPAGARDLLVANNLPARESIYGSISAGCLRTVCCPCRSTRTRKPSFGRETSTVPCFFVWTTISSSPSEISANAAICLPLSLKILPLCRKFRSNGLLPKGQRAETPLGNSGPLLPTERIARWATLTCAQGTRRSTARQARSAPILAQEWSGAILGLGEPEKG